MNKISERSQYNGGHWRKFALALALPLTLTACSDGTGNNAPDTNVGSEVSDSRFAGVAGEPVSTEGVTLTVEEVRESAHLSLNAEGYQAGTMPEEVVEPRDGGKFISVDTTVENTGDEPWDLTCGFALQAELFSADDRQYDSFGELYRLPGNPECNDSLNPGFESNMTWVYEVPEDFTLGYFGFADPNISYDDLTLIDLTDVSVTSESVDAPAPESPEADTPVAEEAEAPAGSGATQQNDSDEFPYRTSGESQAHYGCAEGYIDDPALCGELNDMYGDEPWSP